MRDKALDDDSQIPSEIVSDLGKGMIAGFGATIVVSILLLLKDVSGIVPQFDLIGMLGQMVGSASPLVGWITHFVIGTIVWGLLFAGLDSHLERFEGYGELMRGAFFGVLIYLVMMMFLMPILSLGFFGMKLGIAVPLLALVYNIIYGLVLGAIYGALRPVPAPE
jgi:hypothetical protein